MNVDEILDFTKEYVYLEALNNGSDWEELFAIENPEWDKVRADIIMFMLQYIEDLHELITSTNKIYSFQRGHKIIYFNNEWLYDDNYTSIQIERPCVRCGKMSTKEGYDACLGHIEGISHACCGHGIEHPYYVTNEGEYKTEL